MQAFGLLILHLMTGRTWAGLVDEAMLIDKTAFVQLLDETAGEWPLDLAEGLASLAFRCMASIEGPTNLKVEMIMEELDELRKRADGLVGRRGCEMITNGRENRMEFCEVPTSFLCPIYKVK